ncbi:unnamed protein product [Thelazia callipaeda]|uniref:BRCA1/BRCA2-containing complex subunit 45 n=1 Tax=Thelazia callipaeda TaxID=103827 RepID=A0A0N5D1J4_THECL|nr:unnamed protein product [Thelazia callipaeda]
MDKESLNVWEYFLARCTNLSDSTFNLEMCESDWEWFKQLCDLEDKDFSSDVDVLSLEIRLILRLCFYFFRLSRNNFLSNKLDAGDFVLNLRKTDGFPEAGPEVTSSLGIAFKYFWHDGPTLNSLCQNFTEHCSKLNLAVQSCSDVKYPFTFVSWKLDNDPNCVMITLLFEDSGKSVEYFVLVDWLEPNSFPRSISSSSPEHLRSLRLNKWDPSFLFADNLKVVFCCSTF